MSLFVSIFFHSITLLVQVLTQKYRKWEWQARSHPIGSGDGQESSSGKQCLSEEVVSRVVRLSKPLPVDPWSQLRGDLFKRGRLDDVYGWEESCPTAAS